MDNKKLSIAISPCPNDIFIFYALLNEKIDTRGLKFDFKFLDIEELNKVAIEGSIDICKMSFFCYLRACRNYFLLDTGSALGKNCGPLLIARKKLSLENIRKLKILIPGYNTTAFFLLKYCFPEVSTECVKSVLFSEIEDKLLNNEADAGVIIHENRFTYEKKGLIKLADLGKIWYKNTGLYIPLGCLGIKKNLSVEMFYFIDSLLKESIKFAKENTSEVLEYCSQYADIKDLSVVGKHVKLYVNKYTFSLGKKGLQHIKGFLKIASEFLNVGYDEYVAINYKKL